MADTNIYSKSQLSSYKSKPFVTDILSAHWPWKPEGLVYMLGGIIIFNPNPGLSLKGKPVFGFKHITIPGTDKERIVFDMNLVDPHNNPIASMVDNNMILNVNNLKDFNFTTGSKDFSLTHNSGINLNLRFHRYETRKFRDHILFTTNNFREVVDGAYQYALEHTVDSDGLIPVVFLTGRFRNNELDMKIGKTKSSLTYFIADKGTHDLPPKLLREKDDAVMLQWKNGPEIFKYG